MSLVLDRVGLRPGGEMYLEDISLELSGGSLYVLIGPTLAGKTSLMRVMAGLDRPTTGRVLVDGEDVTGRSVRRRNVAMVYQQFINYPSFSVYDNIAAPLRRAGAARDRVDREVREVAEMLHIEGLLQRLPVELSGGQQQRIALARALVKDADLLLLDEPLVNLDYKLREELRQELRSIFATRDSVVVYATTEPVEALMLGGNAIVVDAGRVLQRGATLEVYNAPASERVGRVFSDPPLNFIDGTVEAGIASLAGDIRVPLGAGLANLAGGRYHFGVRPDSLSIARRHTRDVVIEGTVELAEISGSETFVYVAHHATTWVVRETGVLNFELGAPASVHLDPHALFVFDQAGNLVAARESGSIEVEAANG